MAEARIQIVLSDGRKAGETLKELSKDANRLNKEVRDLKPGTEEFVKKSQDLQKVNARLKEVKDQINGTNQASKALKDAFDQYVPFSGQFKKIGESMGFVQKGVGGLTGGFGLLRAAIVATGIGALVVVLGSLISYLTSTQAGMDKLTSVTRPLAAIFQRLLGVAQQLGEKVFNRLSEAVKNPRQAFIDLGNAIKENIINRFQALSLFGPAIAKIFSGDLSGGFKDLGNAAIQMATGVENVIDKVTDATESVIEWGKEGIAAGTKIDQLTKAIERQEIVMARRTKRLRAEIKDLNFIVEDETATLAEREAAAELAMQKQQEWLQMEIDLIDKKAAKMREEQALNDTSREQERELAELEAKRFELSEQIVEAYTTMRNKLNIIRKREADEEKKLQQAIEDLTIEAMQEGLNKEIAQINSEIDKKKEALKGTAEQITQQELLLEEIRRQKIQAAREAAAKEQEEKEKKAREEALVKRIEAIDLELTQEQNKINEMLLSRQMSENQFILASTENVLNAERRKLEVLRQAHGEQSVEYQNAYANFLKLQQDAAKASIDITKKLNEEQMQALQGGLTVFGNVFGTMAGMYEEGTKQWKEMALAQAIVSTIQGGINAYTSTAAIPIVGPVLAPIAAAAALAAGWQSVRRIENTEVKSAVGETGVPKKEKGGFLSGPRHSQGGVVIEAEGGEFIFSRKTVSALGVDNLTRINDHFTRRKFATGGPVNPFSSRTSDASRPPIASNLIPGMDRMDRLEKAFLNYAARVDAWASTLKVNNVVTETDQGIKVVNQIRTEADT